ncbi:TPM domain-containing protein [Croceicoccus naphthovorans]|uniref:Uncharacterized protein n=1 Tax=Croceicoccus naphthovorans TaxID=1348774 RepID=A0A0G3XCA0_9SPHN|nr:TPM domain-containing protein [Croceicoccus naphthovorans]AKM09170.1 hypothetical protein AB433_02985 [Croceicoccus naphthovorans]MBB3990463.1 uncharacterized protein [Croceicoccus naphthovorans]
MPDWKPFLRLLAAVMLLAGLIAAPARAAMPERPEGPVADYADLLPPDQEAALDQKLRAYNESTGRAVIVLTAPSLEGQPIETYANAVARDWDIGGAETENGLLFVVAPKERELRIEVARGLQGRMTDIMSGRIIRDTVVPQFKAGDMAGGIVAGVDGIIAQLDMDPAEARAIEEAEAARREAIGREMTTASIPAVFFWIMMIVLFAAMFGRRGRGRRYRRGGGISPWVVMWGASELARHASGRGGGWSSGGGGFSSGGGFGGFGGGGGGFNGGGASGSW